MNEVSHDYLLNTNLRLSELVFEFRRAFTEEELSQLRKILSRVVEATMQAEDRGKK